MPKRKKDLRKPLSQKEINRRLVQSGVAMLESPKRMDTIREPKKSKALALSLLVIIIGLILLMGYSIITYSKV